MCTVRLSHLEFTSNVCLIDCLWVMLFFVICYPDHIKTEQFTIHCAFLGWFFRTVDATSSQDTISSTRSTICKSDSRISSCWRINTLSNAALQNVPIRLHSDQSLSLPKDSSWERAPVMRGGSKSYSKYSVRPFVIYTPNLLPWPQRVS